MATDSIWIGLTHMGSNALINYNKAINKVVVLDTNNYKITYVDRLTVGLFKALLVTSLCAASKEMANGP